MIQSKVINFFGGPGAGKTTLAGELFGHMKRKRMDAVYLDETAAHLIRSKSPSINDQFYVTAMQHHKQWSIYGEVEWIITDSPILLGTIYIMDAYENLPDGFQKDQMQEAFKRAVSNLFELYYNINFVVDRGDREYKQIGRRQDETRAKQIDSDLERLLDHYGFYFDKVQTVDQVVKLLGI